MFSGTYLNKLLFLLCPAIENLNSQGSTRLGVFLPENRNRTGFQTIMHLQGIRRWTKSLKKEDVSFNFCCTVFSLLDFLTLEYGTDRLS